MIVSEGEFSRTQELMSKQCIYKDKRKYGIFIQLIIQQEGLHHITFCRKNLDHLVVLKRCATDSFILYDVCASNLLDTAVTGQMLKAAVCIKVSRRKQMTQK